MDTRLVSESSLSGFLPNQDTPAELPSVQRPFSVELGREPALSSSPKETVESPEEAVVEVSSLPEGEPVVPVSSASFPDQATLDQNSTGEFSNLEDGQPKPLVASVFSPAPVSAASPTQSLTEPASDSLGSATSVPGAPLLSGTPGFFDSQESLNTPTVAGNASASAAANHEASGNPLSVSPVTSANPLTTGSSSLDGAVASAQLSEGEGSPSNEPGIVGDVDELPDPVTTTPAVAMGKGAGAKTPRSLENTSDPATREDPPVSSEFPESAQDFDAEWSQEEWNRPSRFALGTDGVLPAAERSLPGSNVPGAVGSFASSPLGEGEAPFVGPLDTVTRAAAMPSLETAGSPLRLAAGALDQQLHTAISQSLRLRSLGDQWTLELRVDPPELGPLRIELQLQEDGVRGVIQYANPRLEDSLQKALPDLEEQLREEGKDAFLDLHSEHEKSSNPSANKDSDAESPATPAGASESEPSAAVTSHHLVDLTA